MFISVEAEKKYYFPSNMLDPVTLKRLQVLRCYGVRDL